MLVSIFAKSKKSKQMYRHFYGSWKALRSFWSQAESRETLTRVLYMITESDYLNAFY